MFTSAQEAEQAFYDALASGDLEAVMRVWADDEEIVCIHPAGMRLVGAEQIRQSWQEVLSQGSLHIELVHSFCTHTVMSATRCHLERIMIRGQFGMQSAYCNVTNVFHNGPSGWQMVLHHASPTDLPEDTPVSLRSPTVLH